MEKVLVYGASGDQGVPLVNTLIKKFSSENEPIEIFFVR